MMIASIGNSTLASLFKIDSVMVQAVMIMLALASLVSWTMIFRKWFSLKAATISANRFEKRFWAGANLSQMYSELSRKDVTPTGMAGIFVDGYREFRRLEQQKNIKPQDILEGVQRAMRVSLSRETDFLEIHLSFLATVGSTSPYVGLFGTVWGIMDAIRKLSGGQPTIGTVAPDISEALIATAMGLFAAIPAVIAYNRYSNNVERLLNRYEIFSEEFISIVQRQTLKSKL